MVEVVKLVNVVVVGAGGRGRHWHRASHWLVAPQPAPSHCSPAPGSTTPSPQTERRAVNGRRLGEPRRATTVPVSTVQVASKVAFRCMGPARPTQPRHAALTVVPRLVAVSFPVTGGQTSPTDTVVVPTTIGSCGAALSPATSAPPATRKRPPGQGDGFFAITGVATARARAAIETVRLGDLISMSFSDGA